MPGGGAGFYECRRGGRQKNGPQKLCDIHKNAAKNLSEIFWSAGRILALFLRIFPVSMVLCCRVWAGAGSRFGAIPPPFHSKSGKRSGGRYRSRNQGVDFCEKARLCTAAAVRKTAQLCQKTKKHRPNGRCFLLIQAQHSGPSGESRTHGLLNPIQARYQTALHPVTAGLDNQHNLL